MNLKHVVSRQPLNRVPWIEREKMTETAIQKKRKGGRCLGAVQHVAGSWICFSVTRGSISKCIRVEVEYM